MKNYKQVVEKFENEIIIKKSRFITTLMPIFDAQDAEIKLKQIQKKYSDATHNCYCYISNIIATEQRFSDDGEPQGTAGIPMLEVLKKNEVFMTLAVVTRYFGGIKLGASGLVGAYTDSVVQALKNADLRTFCYSYVVNFTASYSIYPKLESFIIETGGKILNIEYDQAVTATFAIQEEKFEQLKEKMIDFSSGKVNLEVIKKEYVDYV